MHSKQNNTTPRRKRAHSIWTNILYCSTQLLLSDLPTTLRAEFRVQHAQQCSVLRRCSCHWYRDFFRHCFPVSLLKTPCPVGHWALAIVPRRDFYCFLCIRIMCSACARFTVRQNIVSSQRKVSAQSHLGLFGVAKCIYYYWRPRRTEKNAVLL